MIFHDRRKDLEIFDIALLVLLLMLFSALLYSITRDTVKPEVITVLGGGLGVVIGYVGAAVQSRWGAPKKVADAAPAFQATTTSTRTETLASTEPAPPKPE